ncbi:MAG: hypothetical protein WEA09_05675 [Gemmatimonadota bacterium]
MPSPEPQTELYFRYGQWSLVVLLFLILTLGVLFIGLLFFPENTLLQSLSGHAPLAGTLVIAGLFAMQLTMLRGARWNLKAPEVRAVLDDEWRRTNMDRAVRAAFVLVLVAQVPMAWVLSELSPLYPLMVMAIVTGILGLSALIAAYLVFARQGSNGG